MSNTINFDQQDRAPKGMGVNSYFSIEQVQLETLNGQKLYHQGLICLSIATKLEEDKIFCIKNVLIELQYSVSVDYLQKIEQEILQKLEWVLNLPTPIEISKQMLYYTNCNFDFNDICSQINNFIFLCLLEHLQMLNFRNQLATFIHENFDSIDYISMIECKKVLQLRIQNGEQDGSVDNAQTTTGNTHCSPTSKAKFNSYLEQSDPASLEYLFSSLCLQKKQYHGFNSNEVVQKTDRSLQEQFLTRSSNLTDTNRPPIVINNFQTISRSKVNQKLCPLAGDDTYISEKDNVSTPKINSSIADQDESNNHIPSENIFSSSNSYNSLGLEEMDERSKNVDYKFKNLMNSNQSQIHQKRLSIASGPHIFVSHVERFFQQQRQLNVLQQPQGPLETNFSGEIEVTSPQQDIESDEEQDDQKTFKYSIISDEELLKNEQEAYRQIRYLKSNSSLKDSLISMFVSSTLFIPEEKNTDSKRTLIEPGLNPSYNAQDIQTQRGININSKHLKNQYSNQISWNPFASYQQNYRSPGQSVFNNRFNS
ncbi:UNKNOWN [Stylonychia lemnae]|uniref:Cyclin N-terminal domain-containing protein n=1 Tax=Stylonychia lemnae TaxID=5949 RepID=A0A078A998_STYLE|nr:UNKNOWN [Stylonychia lemnae]|eukprot:CDW78147.1 UNKNOWN [Stylonychia lemnae]